jgi:hypothetical protein
MSLSDRLELEQNQLDFTTFHQKNCFNCKFWVHKVKQDYKNCHKCINNTSISLKKDDNSGYSIEGLRDYYVESLKGAKIEHTLPREL